MTSDLENFYATCEHRRPGRILYRAGFVPDLRDRLQAHVGEGKSIEEHYGMFIPTWIGVDRPADLPPLDFSKYWEGQDLPKGTTLDGNGVAMVPSGFYHFWGYISPLRNATDISQLENYPMDDVAGWDTSGLKAKVDDAHRQGKVAIAFPGHMYESAWQIRGYEEFLMDMIERPAWAECLLDRIFQQNLLRARACAKAGVDFMMTGDDVANQNAMMFSPDTWRRMIHSRWARVWAEVHQINPRAKTWYHSDGNIINIVQDMVDAGLDILNPLQPESLDVDEVHRRWGKTLSFEGCIGTQSTMPFGTPDEVRARVKEVIEKYGGNGGLIVAPTHVLEPDVPIANVEALCDACREYGTFERA